MNLFSPPSIGWSADSRKFLRCLCEPGETARCRNRAVANELPGFTPVIKHDLISRVRYLFAIEPTARHLRTTVDDTRVARYWPDVDEGTAAGRHDPGIGAHGHNHRPDRGIYCIAAATGDFRACFGGDFAARSDGRSIHDVP